MVHGERFDVCVVGAGPSGAVTAARLAQSGFRVAVLEQGDWPDYSKARAAHPDFEINTGPQWAWDPNVRGLDCDYPINVDDSDIDVLLYNAVGGGSVIYAAQWHRNLPSDFCVRTLDGVADDWPFGYDALVPFYERVEKVFGISGLGGDPAFPPGEGPPLPPSPLGRIGRRVAAAHNELGWHWWPGPNAIATRDYGPLKACVQRAACLWTCADGAKSSVDLTYWPSATAAGVHLVTETGIGQVRVGIQLLDAASRLIGPDFARCELDEDVRPGESCRVLTTFVTPPEPGEYGLKLNLVAEGITWFGPRGTKVAVRPLKITSP